MKLRGEHYICDTCHLELDPRQVYAVTVSQIGIDGLYHVDFERHFCPKCLRIAKVRVEQSTEVM